MAKYRVKDHVGAIRHGVGGKTKDYPSGSIIELSDDEAETMAAHVELVAELKDEGKDKKSGKDK